MSSKLRTSGVLFLCFVLMGIALAGVRAQDDVEEQNKEIARRVIEELWGGENLTLDNTKELFAPTGLWHFPLGTVPCDACDTATQLNVLQDIENWRRAFPDLQLTVENMIAEDNLVVIHYTFQGTFERRIRGGFWFPNIPPSGNEEGWDGIFIFRFENDQIAEQWWYWNNNIPSRE